MPKSFHGLVAETVSGRNPDLNFILSDALLSDLLESLRLQALDQMVWAHSPVATEPSGVTATAQSFFRWDERGKMQFCVRFPSGATQVVCTEPD